MGLAIMRKNVDWFLGMANMVLGLAFPGRYDRMEVCFQRDMSCQSFHEITHMILLNCALRGDLLGKLSFFHVEQRNEGDAYSENSHLTCTADIGEKKREVS